MKRTYSAIFLVSCSILMLEVSLTRLFSIYLWYHFAFMVISIAMLGIGSAGTMLSVYPVRKKTMFESSNVACPRLKETLSIPFCAMSAGASIILCYIISNLIPFDPVKLSWDRMQIFYVALYCFVLSIPFFFSGVLIASTFSMYSEKSGLIYGADLIGAGTGSLLVLCLLNISSPEYAVLTASTLCFIGALIAGEKKIKALSIIFIAINLLIIITHPDFINIRISPYKPLSLSLKYPGAQHLKTYHNSFFRVDILKSPAVRFAPGLSLKYLEPLPEQIGLSIDGGDMNAVTRADNRKALTFLEFLPSALAYEIGGKNNVLVLEPKGGLQALMAEYYGAKKVHKIESNPLIVRVIKDSLGEFSGRIFEHDIWTGLGRNWLHSSRGTVHGAQFTGHGSQSYDIIDIPMIGTSVAGAFGIAEDYRFTVEAFRKYLSAVKEDGLLNINLYLIPPPRTELRLLATVIAALENTGITDASRHIASVRSWDSLSIIVKNSPLNDDEIKKIKKFAHDRRFDLVHYPGIDEKETNIYIKTPQNEYFEAFKNILNPENRQSFVRNYLFDITPVYDDNPFPHYYLKFRNVKAIYEVMGQKWQYFIEEGYLLPVVFISVLLLSFMLILLPVIVKAKVEVKAKKKKNLNLSLSLLFYFSMLALGFMFVEVTLIQKGLLLLENPSYAVATVLTAILISSGGGSLLSSRFSKLKTPYLLVVLGCLILIYSVTLPWLTNTISSMPLKVRIPVVFLFLLPLGFFMGIPFPLGIKLLGQIDETYIPWAWAINGCFSVLSPILTVMIAMLVGLKIVLWLGAMAYFIAFVSLKKVHSEQS